MADSDFDYTGLHAFVFIDHVPRDETPRSVVSRLREFGPPDGPVLFAAEVVGPYVAFAHLRVEDDDLGRLHDLISGELRDRGVRCTYGVEGTVHSNITTGIHVGPKRATPEIIALVRIKVERGLVMEVLQRLGELPAFKGASTVSGDFDILLQLGGERLSDVMGPAMNDLQDVAGIVRTSTAFIDGTR